MDVTGKAMIFDRSLIVVVEVAAQVGTSALDRLMQDI